MHELSICQALIEQVEALAREEDALQVVQVRVAIGPLSGVEPQLLQQAFQLARAGSIAATASLLIDPLPVRVSCRECGQETGAEVANLVCGNCGDWHTELVSGDEMLLTHVELVRNTPAGILADTTIN
ncbi:MAG: hydrogenase maturation nickel metallochaperone HypA [Gammaproteobacteria bacterium]